MANNTDLPDTKKCNKLRSKIEDLLSGESTKP